MTFSSPISAQTTVSPAPALSQQPQSTTANSSQPSIKQGSESDCDEALNQLKRGLTEGRQLSVPYQVEQEAFGDYPEGRPIIYTVAMQGPATASVFNSPQLLLNLSKSFIEKCDSAAAVKIGRYQTGQHAIFGLVEGQVTLFGCAENLGFELGARGEQAIPWGYDFCGL